MEPLFELPRALKVAKLDEIVVLDEIDMQVLVYPSDGFFLIIVLDD
ncbi:hypothetical protein [Senegalimassilia anaerobia]|nr:hypothetical protein [Senegalimassilia anaerobia]